MPELSFRCFENSRNVEVPSGCAYFARFENLEACKSAVRSNDRNPSTEFIPERGEAREGRGKKGIGAEVSDKLSTSRSAVEFFQ